MDDVVATMMPLTLHCSMLLMMKASDDWHTLKACNVGAISWSACSSHRSPIAPSYMQLLHCVAHIKTALGPHLDASQDVLLHGCRCQRRRAAAAAAVGAAAALAVPRTTWHAWGWGWAASHVLFTPVADQLHQQRCGLFVQCANQVLVGHLKLPVNMKVQHSWYGMCSGYVVEHYVPSMSCHRRPKAVTDLFKHDHRRGSDHHYQRTAAHG